VALVALARWPLTQAVRWACFGARQVKAV